MAFSPVLNPEIPYVGEVEGGLAPGKLVKIQGKVPENAVRFAINYQLGPNLNPRDDIALHLSPRFSDGFITRNHIQSMSWGPEENRGPLIIQPGQRFEVIILCEPLQYKIAINGRHYTEFNHRLQYQNVTHLVIDGDVEVESISYEKIGGPPPSPMSAIPPDVPAPNFGPPGAGGIYPSLGPQTPSMPQGVAGYGPRPDAYGGSGGYNPPRDYGYKPGYEKAEEEDTFGGCLDKVGLAVGGLVAAGGLAAVMHAMNKKDDSEKDHEKSNSSKVESESGLGGLGALGAALASSLASNALHGDSRNSQGHPSQDSGAGGMLDSILGAIGGNSSQLPGFPQNQQSQNDSLGGLGALLGGGGLGSLLGGGGGGHHQNQQSSNDALGNLGSLLGGGGLSSFLGGGGGSHQHPDYQPSGGYPQQQGGYGSQGSDTSNLLNGIGGALFNSALDSLTKHKSREDHPPASFPQNPPQYQQNYGSRDDPSPPHVQPRATTPPAPGGGKLSAADISKGLGLGDDED